MSSLVGPDTVFGEFVFHYKSSIQSHESCKEFTLIDKKFVI